MEVKDRNDSRQSRTLVDKWSEETGVTSREVESRDGEEIHVMRN